MEEEGSSSHRFGYLIAVLKKPVKVFRSRSQGVGRAARCWEARSRLAQGCTDARATRPRSSCPRRAQILSTRSSVYVVTSPGLSAFSSIFPLLLLRAFPHKSLDERKTIQCSWGNRGHGGRPKPPPLGLLGRAGSPRSHLSPPSNRVFPGHAVNPQNFEILFSKSSCTRFNEPI